MSTRFRFYLSTTLSVASLVAVLAAWRADRTRLADENAQLRTRNVKLEKEMKHLYRQTLEKQFEISLLRDSLKQKAGKKG